MTTPQTLHQHECPSCGHIEEAPAKAYWHCSHCGRGWVMANHKCGPYPVQSNTLSGPCPKCGLRLKVHKRSRKLLGDKVPVWDPIPDAKATPARVEERRRKAAELRKTWWLNPAIFPRRDLHTWEAKCLAGPDTTITNKTLTVSRDGIGYGLRSRSNLVTWPEVEELSVDPGRKRSRALLSVLLRDGTQRVFELHTQPVAVTAKLRPVLTAMEQAKLDGTQSGDTNSR